jgi:hypothetical protein
MGKADLDQPFHGCGIPLKGLPTFDHSYGFALVFADIHESVPTCLLLIVSK